MNVANIKGLEDIFSLLDEICNDEKKYDDEELAKKLREVYDFCSGGHDGKNYYLITHMRSTNLLKKRAKQYCKKHNIKLKDYKGVLPYRKYFIDTLPK
jgi:hypothetical protein